MDDLGEGFLSGGVTGVAGPCIVLSGGELPFLGVLGALFGVFF